MMLVTSLSEESIRELKSVPRNKNDTYKGISLVNFWHAYYLYLPSEIPRVGLSKEEYEAQKQFVNKQRNKGLLLPLPEELTDYIYKKEKPHEGQQQPNLFPPTITDTLTRLDMGNHRKITYTKIQRCMIGHMINGGADDVIAAQIVGAGHREKPGLCYTKEKNQTFVSVYVDAVKKLGFTFSELEAVEHPVGSAIIPTERNLSELLSLLREEITGIIPKNNIPLNYKAWCYKHNLICIHTHIFFCG